MTEADAQADLSFKDLDQTASDSDREPGPDGHGDIPIASGTSSWPPAPITPQPSAAVPLPRWLGAAVVGVVISIAASVALAGLRVPGTGGVVGGLFVGALASGVIVRAKSPSRWAAAAVNVVFAQLLFGVGLALALGAMSGGAASRGPSGQLAAVPTATRSAEPSPTTARPTLPSEATPAPSPTPAAEPIGWTCTLSAHPSAQVWIYQAAEMAQDCAWLDDWITLDRGESMTMILNPTNLVPTDPVSCEIVGSPPNVVIVTDSSPKHTVGAALCSALGAKAGSSAFVNRGMTYWSEGKYDLAVSDFTRAIKLHPSDAAGLIGRGFSYEGEGKYDLAIADFTDAIKLDPTSALAFQGRGQTYYMLREYDLAVADLSKSIDLDPTVVLAFQGRGSAYFLLGKYDLAVADFTKAIKLDPTDASLFLGRGNAYRNGGDLKLAAADFTSAIKLDPTNVWAFQARGAVRATDGDIAGATADFDRALSLTTDPDLISNIKQVRCSVGLACE